MTSPLREWASFMESSVLPTAVGPKMISKFGLGVLDIFKMSDLWSLTR